MITVVIPTCDRPAQLSHALEQVARQTHAPAAVLVVDNGREPARITGGNGSASVQCIQAPQRCGASQARNIGACLARTPWVAFLDDDDGWAPDYLAELDRAIAAAPQAVVHLARAVFVHSDGRSSSRVLDPGKGVRRALYLNPGAVGSNMAVRRDSFFRVGGFDPCLPSSEDRALLWELSRQGADIRVQSARLAYINQHDGERLTDTANLLAGKTRFFWKYRRQMYWSEWLKTALILGYVLWRAVAARIRKLAPPPFWNSLFKRNGRG